MCETALPEHIDEVEEWKFTDHDTWLMRWFIPIKLKYLCFGPRDIHKWHRWREWPVVLLKTGSTNGFWRYENDITESMEPFLTGGYLSRIQYWKRWHFQLQWPFFIAFHWYWNEEDVPAFPHRSSKVIYFYFGAHRDADKIYFIPSLFLGIGWK